MRKAISIIELIFTIVIIALVFTVIPKVIFALKKSDSFAIRQDAIMNTISLVQMISKLPWDEKNVDSSDILHVDDGNLKYKCTTSGYRVGGFIGSRNCENNLTASTSGNFDDGESKENFDDVDDYDTASITTKLYEINITVSYCSDFTQTSYIDLSSCSLPTGSTNRKKISVVTDYNGTRGEKKELMSFDYTSVNIGQFFLHKRVWQ